MVISEQRCPNILPVTLPFFVLSCICPCLLFPTLHLSSTLLRVPAPRAPAQPSPLQAPRVATSSAPPHKVESAPALFDLLSLNDPAPAKAPTSPAAAPPAATATAAPAQSPGGWAAFPEPTGASQPATTAAPVTSSAGTARCFGMRNRLVIRFAGAWCPRHDGFRGLMVVRDSRCGNQLTQLRGRLFPSFKDIVVIAAALR